MVLRVEFENVLTDGEKKYRIVAVESYCGTDVPDTYSSGPGAYCYTSHNGRVFIAGYNQDHSNNDDRSASYHHITIGDNGALLSEKEASDVVDIVKLAGPRLHKINEEIRALKRDWDGKKWSVRVSTREEFEELYQKYVGL